MDPTEIPGIVLAAQEQLPAEPSDLTALLLDPASRAALLNVDPRGLQDPLLNYLCDHLDGDRIAYWRRATKRLIDDGVAPLVAGSAGYPSYQAGYWNPPPMFFARGQLPQLDPSSVAIIGSRHTEGRTLKETRALAADIGANGIVVVSGLAAGVDTSAHQGALDVDGVTVAVLGTGIDNVYPLQNEMLAHEIAVRGAVISQFVPDAPRTPTSFLRRNNVIAGLSTISLVMAADERSGSRHEIEQAVSYGRPVLFWERTLRDQAWAVELVNMGYGVFVDSSASVIDILRSTYVDR